MREIEHRCSYVNMKNPLYIRYHDEVWGMLEHSDQKLYELLILEFFQAGLSWECILNKRENFRTAFDGFDIDKVCAYDEAKCAELMNNPGIVRNRRKIAATVNSNIIFKKIQKEFGSFDVFIWGFTNSETIVEDYHIRTTSPLSDMISKDLKKHRMKFVGSTIIYSYLQAIDMLNAHGEEYDLCPDRLEDKQ